MTSLFLSTNRGKRSIAFDLKHPDVLAIVRQLVRAADVIVRNFRPGAMERLGQAYEVVRESRNDVIYVSISSFGPHSPYADATCCLARGKSIDQVGITRALRRILSKVAGSGRTR